MPVLGNIQNVSKQGKFENTWNKSLLIYTENNFVFKIQYAINKTVIKISKYLIKEWENKSDTGCDGHLAERHNSPSPKMRVSIKQTCFPHNVKAS